MRPQRLAWTDRAACRTAEPDLFFPISAKGRARADIARAQAICAICPVRSPCLDFALTTGQTHGVWGGLTEEERLKRQARPQPGAA